MLRITSQFFSGRYQGNPMGITTQCSECGRTYDQLQGQLESCEFCNEPYCDDCINYHERQHTSDPKEGPIGHGVY
jgi:hypothetical protein